MYKKSLLLCTAAIAVTLFGTHFNAYAENLEVADGKVEKISQKTYETIHAKPGGKITGEKLTITGNKDTNKDTYVVKAEGDNSEITLTGSTIKSNDNDSDIHLGIKAKDGAKIKMTGGRITAIESGASFENSRSENELTTVIISGKDDHFIDKGINATHSNLTLKDTTVSLANNGIFAEDHSAIKVSSGVFNGKTNGVYAKQGSSITLDGKTTVTSSEGNGIHTEDSGAKVTMVEGTVSGKQNALFAEKGGKIDVSNITLTANGTGTGAKADGSNSTVELHKNTTIKDAFIGLQANGGTIKMTDGSITASIIGAVFSDSKSNENENKLENVTISSGQSGRFIDKGINAEKSTVTLNKVTVTNANTGIFANDDSTITVSEGSFDGKTNGVYAKQGSSITLDEKTTVTSSEGNGIHAEGSEAKITKTGGTVSGKQNALFAEKGGKIDVTDVALTTTDGKGTGAKADGTDSVITLKGKTTIEKVANGLEIENGATIKMTDGSITASQIGAVFNASKSNENKLENVTISSGKGNPLMDKGINAEKSTVTLNKVTVTNANTGIFANDDSTITVSEGSFDGKTNGVYAKQGSSIILDEKTTVTSSEGNGIHAEGSEAKITKTGGTISGKQNALFAEKGGKIAATDVTLTTDGRGTGAFAHGEKSTIELHGNTTINNTFNGLGASVGGKITSENLTITGGKAINLETPEVQSAVWVGESGEINLTGTTTIRHFDEGLYADSGGKIVSGDLTIIGGESKKATIGVSTWESESKIELNGNTTIQNTDIGLGAIEDATIKMKNGTKNEIKAKKNVLAVVNGGHMDLTNLSATAEIGGLQFANSTDNDPHEHNDPQKYRSNEINLNHAIFNIDNGRGILIGAIVEKSIENSPALSIGTLNLKDSEIHADILLDDGIFWNKISWQDKNMWDGKEVKEIANGSFTLNADHSTLEGRANIAKERNVSFNLTNGTQWFLKNSTQEKDTDGNLLDIAQRSRSDISVLSLENSSVVFKEPTEDHYHTLHIGSGKPDTQEVYNATGDAKIYFNAEWSDGVAIADQKTDRLLINGNVAGTTAVYVTGRLEDNNVKQNISTASNIRGLSLIQVSGKATEDSFKLVNGYTTRDGLPDKYTLRAYGPESSHGQANIEQNLFDEKNENFWDFRLQPELLGTDSGSGSGTGSGSSPSVIAPVPQTASYLVMPNALFHAGLTDIAKQNALLATMRTSVLGKEEEKQTGFFLYTYGNTATLSSERGPLKYGYGADIRYAALQAGVTLAAIEGQNTSTHLGFVGTYGQLSFTPKNIADAGKSTLDKWALTAYGSIQHSSGFYIDTLLSYGILKGHIANALIGKTAKLNNAKMFSISTTVGKEFATGVEGLTFEPQAQVAYQHLMFNTIEDADNFTIDMKNPSQWLIRVGGRLTKTISTENNRPMSFYGKVNLIKTFGDDGSIHIGRDFELDPMGPAIEGGVGINAQLSHNFSLHGDVSYQQKLQKTGISGASFSGGIRYQF